MTSKDVKIDIKLYHKANGEAPYLLWLSSLKDATTRGIIRKRIDRLKLGNAGVARSVGQGVHELKIDYGPGYRIYFGNDGSKTVILLCGGDKSTQNSDVRLAQAYWADYWS